jgi:hypothetical protein
MVSIELLADLFRYGLHISNTNSCQCLSVRIGSVRIGGGCVPAGDLPSRRVRRKRPSGGVVVINDVVTLLQGWRMFW